MGFNFPRINIPAPKPIHISPIRLPPPPPTIRVPTIRLPLLPPPKIDEHALRKSLGVIAGVISLNPIGKVLVMGTMGIADAITGGKGSDYVNDGHKVNSTLSMLPGGMLLQQFANDIDPRSGEALNKYIPDPKKMIINDAIKIGVGVAKNPTNTLHITEQILTQKKKTIMNSAVVVAMKPQETLHAIIKPLPDKPTIFTAPISFPTISIPTISIPFLKPSPSVPTPPVIVPSSTLAPATTPVIIPTIPTIPQVVSSPVLPSTLPLVVSPPVLPSTLPLAVSTIHTTTIPPVLPQTTTTTSSTAPYLLFGLAVCGILLVL